MSERRKSQVIKTLPRMNASFQNSFLSTSLSSNSASHNSAEELECDLIYCDYLQAVMKKQIMETTIKKHEQDIQDQLIIQKDKLHKSRVSTKKAKEECTKLDTVADLLKIIQVMEQNFKIYENLNKSGSTVEEFLTFLDFVSCMIKSEGVILEDVDKFQEVLTECALAGKKLDFIEENLQMISDLANLIGQYSNLKSSVEDKQNLLDQMKENKMFNLLKILSDMYAQKEEN